MLKLCPHGEERADKSVTIGKAQAAGGCNHYAKSKWHEYCWRYRVGLDHCNRIDIPMTEPENSSK
jgi:hypothetical protein